MPTSPKKIIFCPNLDGSCVASAIAHALIYITHKVLINNDDTLIQHSESIITLAQVMNDHEPVANLKTACRIILGNMKESFTDKERRIMLTIKDHAQTSLRLFTKIAENTLVALEVCGIEFDDDWLIHACEIDKSKAAAYQALAEHIANTHRQNLEKTEPKSLDYQQFGLTRIAVLDILLSYEPLAILISAVR